MRAITTATRGAVQTLPRKPWASAPWERRTGIWARWSALKREGGPGAMRRRKDSLPPSRARFSHWLIAPSVTPNARAMARCFQPCWANSQARKRRHSRRSRGDSVVVLIADPPAHLGPPLQTYARINNWGSTDPRDAGGNGARNHRRGELGVCSDRVFFSLG